MSTDTVPALPDDYQVDLAANTVSVECHEPQCDEYGRQHVMPAGMEPAVHDIVLTHVALSKDDGGREWRMWLTNTQDEYSERQAAQLLRDITTAKALMHDLNATH